MFVSSSVFAITGQRTTYNLPQNIDGNQGVIVYAGTISGHNIRNGYHEVTFSGFSNNMDSVNFSVFAGTKLLINRMNVASNYSTYFELPENSALETFTIVMSTNSDATGTASVNVSIN